MVWTLSKSKPFFCQAFVKNMKRQVRDWAKMFASHIYLTKDKNLDYIKMAQNSRIKQMNE